MIMLIILVLGAASLLVSSFNSSAVQIGRDKTTSAALAQAKEALIGYALTYADTHSNTVPGYLPCPDISGTAGATGEGSSDTCGNQDVSSIGRLPWKTLSLEPLRDGYGECLWYAVSGTYKNNPKTALMNWDNPGLLSVSDASGNTISDVVAVVFAPGPPLSGDNRTPSGSAPLCGGNYTASNYLDSDGTHNNSTVSGTANATSNFYSGTSSQVNDRLIYITRQDIWNAMLKRNDFMTTLKTMTERTAECIADYGRRNYGGSNDKRLPWSGRLYNPSTDYKTDSNYDDEDGRMAGRLPYRVNTSDSETYNQISSPYYQLASDGDNCPHVADWPSYYPWWSNWKDHLFYSLAWNFRPNSGSTSCYSYPYYCLSVNGSGRYAAVVIFAGQALAGQTRATDSDRLNLSNYLEGSNISSYPNSSGRSNYQSGATSSSFNDVLYCINSDLSVTPC
ncbi:MAG: hypothetical protein GC139_06695 [Sideroxydans sp.]|nr:hypothetical protein [Sideroxydans sp.]